MTPRRRTTATRIATGWGALAALIALAASGCSATSAPADPGSGTYHGLTIAEAQSAYRSYVSVSNTAAAQGDKAQSLSIVGDAQWSIVNEQFTALASARTPVPTYRYGRPTFYVPALTTWSQWFMVAVPRTAETGAQAGTTASTVLLFEKRGPDLPWTVDGSVVLNQPLPAVARDKDGYAIALSTADSDLLLPPDVVGATQAAVVDQGPAAASATVVADGPLTTGWYQAQAAQARSDAAQDTQYQWLLEGSDFALFSLKTADGGALVMYGMYLNTTAEHRGLAAGAPIPVPAEFTPLTGPTQVGYHAVYANWTYEFAAVDPPPAAHGAKLQVIASGGGPTYGHAY
ncbi:MAG TPA: hypothetical protein VME19_06030 [Streptosporangiaceae bacterium]|nr:hypothetical protein [Streptosporangiaceae bacterium]